MNDPSSLKLFYVSPSEGPSDAGHLVTGATDAEEAALFFAERWLTDEPLEELRLMVVDGFTGERCCLSIDLSTGAVGSC